MVARRLVSALMLASFAPLALGLGGCGGSVGSNAASQVLKKPELPTDTEAKCSVRKSQSEPLIVEWPNASRGRLESSTTKKGLVAIKYEGCELTQLACTVKSTVGPYAYWPITRKQSHVAIKDADDLYASMPVGAVKLEGKLKSAGQLDVAMTIVGRYEAPTREVYRGDLEGPDCDQATHVIAALTVGAFTFSAGADAEVGGEAKLGPASGGARSTAKRETLQSDGDEAACARATTSDKGPPEGCGALLQIEVATVKNGKRPYVAPVVVVPPPPAPAPTEPVNPPPLPDKPKPTKPIKCKKGEHAEDGVCVKGPAKKPGTKPAPGIASLGSTCTAGQHKEGTKCVDDPAPAPEPPPPVPNTECAEGMRWENGSCVSGHIAQPTAPPPIDNEPSHERTPSSYDVQLHKTEQPNPWKGTMLYSTLGFGVLGLTSGYLALIAAGKVTDDSGSECNADKKTCNADGMSDKSKATTFAILADASFGLAAASFLIYCLLPSTMKVGIAPTPHGGVANLGWTFR